MTGLQNVTIQNVEMLDFNSPLWIYDPCGGAASTSCTHNGSAINISNVQILDNYAHCTNINCPATNGLTIYYTTNTLVQGNMVANIGGNVNAPTYTTGNGILVAGNGPNTMINQFNVVHDVSYNLLNAGAGNWYIGLNAGTIQQFNEVWNSGAQISGTGVSDGQSFDIDCGNNGTIVQYNYSHHNGQGLMLWAGGYCGLPWSNNIIRYNISENDGFADRGQCVHSGSGSCGSLKISGGSTDSGSAFYNNTVYTHGATLNSGQCFGADTSGNASKFYNNICYNDNGNYFVDAVSGGDFDYNDYYRVGTAPATQFYFAGNSYSSLGAWQNPGNQDPHGTTANPGFAGTVGTGGTCNTVPLSSASWTSSCPTNYQLAFSSSPMIGAGINVSGLFTTGNSTNTQDYYGVGIPHTVRSGYNIGADGSAHGGSR